MIKKEENIFNFADIKRVQADAWQVDKRQGVLTPVVIRRLYY